MSYTVFPVLKLGDANESVKTLQEKLKILGLFPASANQSFGRSTEIAVKQFQSDNNLPVTGVADEMTWIRLIEKTDEALKDRRQEEAFDAIILPTVQPGSNGENVKKLQEYLKALDYYDGAITSNFDEATEAAVKLFQSANKFTANGIVDEPVWNALNHLYEPLADCGDYFLYTVKAGDTLWLLAQRYGTTVDAIKQLNGLTSDNLSIGQVLKIPGNEPGPSPDPDYFLHTVVAGDTLWKLAQRYGTTVDAIKRLNGLTSDNLSIGQVLKIPSNSPSPGPTPDPDYFLYTVVSGDTLWLLARRFGTTVDAIKQLNGLTSDSLRIGQVLKIPSASSGGSGGSGGGSTGYFNHTVTSGETLWILAQRYGTTVDAIKQLNGLTSDALSIGQVLKIPSASSGGNGGGSTGYFNHTVTSGETLWILANRYGTTVDAIKQLNGLTSDALSIGQVLKIPQKATSASVNSGVSAVSVPKKEIELEVVEVKPESKTKPAVIQAFDITTGIASPTGDTEIISSYNPDAIADIQLSNAEAVIPPNSDNVFAANTDISSYAPQTSIDTPVYINQSNETLGTKVVETCQCQEEEIVPDDTINECGNVVHTVVKGETLWSLAHKYGTSSKEIMCLNCLSCPTLCVGQVIEIPANPAFANFDKCGKPCPKASSQVIYSVKAGDSLWNIARKYNTTVEAIMKYNFLSSDVLTLGQRMYIPISVKPDVSESSRLYIVKAGDSLWTIAQKFGTTVESIYKKNNLSTDVLQIGKVLEI